MGGGVFSSFSSELLAVGAHCTLVEVHDTGTGGEFRLGCLLPSADMTDDDADIPSPLPTVLFFITGFTLGSKEPEYFTLSMVSPPNFRTR